jgi:hypothetical protein
MGKVVLVFQFLSIREKEQSVFLCFHDKNKMCNPVIQIENRCKNSGYEILKSNTYHFTFFFLKNTSITNYLHFQ